MSGDQFSASIAVRGEQARGFCCVILDLLARWQCSEATIGFRRRTGARALSNTLVKPKLLVGTR